MKNHRYSLVFSFAPVDTLPVFCYLFCYRRTFNFFNREGYMGEVPPSLLFFFLMLIASIFVLMHNGFTRKKPQSLDANPKPLIAQPKVTTLRILPIDLRKKRGGNNV
jgi:hypothetical protein